MTRFEDDLGWRLVRYELLLFVVAGIADRLLFGGLTIGTYARMLAWAALLSWVLAALTMAQGWLVLRFQFDPLTYWHGQHQLKEWGGFFFLAGMVPFAASALLGWVA